MFTDKFLYGPALVDAVQLEKSAIFPRILLGESVLKYIKADGPAADLAIRDSDGKTFLHYLGGIAVWLKAHRDYVHHGLLSNAGRVHERQKYEWPSSGRLPASFACFPAPAHFKRQVAQEPSRPSVRM